MSLLKPVAGPTVSLFSGLLNRNSPFPHQPGCFVKRRFQPPRDTCGALDEALFLATAAGLAAARPGAACSDIWHAMARKLAEKAVRGSDVGRMGHGLGLAVTEPPSIHPKDFTILEPGMVLTLEPGIGYIGKDGRKKVLVHEENIVVTESGAEFLSKRGWREMPVVG